MPPRSRRAADLAGLGLVVASGLWVALAASRAETARPWPVIGLLAAVVVAVAVGRGAGRWLPVLGPAVLATGITGLLVLSLRTLPDTLGRPLGYANANATFAGLGVLAALGAVVAGWPPARSSQPARRQLSAQAKPWTLLPIFALAALLAALVLVPTSAASVLALATAAALGGLALQFRNARVAVAGGAIVGITVLVVSVGIAEGADPAGLGTTSAARGDLWTGAADLAQEHPWFGIGPGMFAEQNPVTDDPDLRWVHHGYLQMAAELGLPGLLLTLGLVAWAYGRLWLATWPTRTHGAAPSTRQVGTVAAGAGAVTLVALHAVVDYVGHFPAVVSTAALLLGWATATTRRSTAS